MTWREYELGVAGPPLEPPEVPEPTYKTCTAKGCEGGIVYAGRVSFDTGDATLIGGEDWQYCPRCGGDGYVAA